MSKIKLIYPKQFKEAVIKEFPTNNVLKTALENNKYSVGTHLEHEVNKVKVSSDEIISSIELGIPSKQSIVDRETKRRRLEGLYTQWLTFIEERVDEYEREREEVSGESSNK